MNGTGKTGFTLIETVIAVAVFAVLVTVVGIRAGFPAWWSASEGPTLAALSLVLHILLRKALAGEEPEMAPAAGPTERRAPQ